MRIKTTIILIALLLTLSTVFAEEAVGVVCVNTPQATDLTNIQKTLEQKGLSPEQAEPLVKGIQQLIQDGINNVEERAQRSFLEKLTEQIKNNDIIKFVSDLFGITEVEPHEQKISTRVSQLSLRPTDDLNKQVLRLRKKFLEYMLAQKGRLTSEQYTELITDALPVFEHFSQKERMNFIKELYILGDQYGELPESGILNLKAAYGRLMGTLIEQGPGIYEINIDTLKVDLKKLNTQASGVHTVADQWKNSAYKEYQRRYEQQYGQNEPFFGAYQKNLGAFSYQKLDKPKGELIFEDDNFAVYETELDNTEKEALTGVVAETENSPNFDDETRKALKGNLGIVSKRYIIKVKKKDFESLYEDLFNSLFKQFLVTSHLDKTLENQGEKATVSSRTLKEVFEKILENKKKYEEAKKELREAEKSGDQQKINDAKQKIQRILQESGAIMESFKLGEIISSSRKIKELEKLKDKLTPLTTAKTKEELEAKLAKAFEEEKGRKLEDSPTEIREREYNLFLSEIFSKIIDFEILKRLGMRAPSGHEKYSEIKGKALFVRLIEEINKGNNQFDLVNIDVHDMGKTNLASAVELVTEFYESQKNTFEDFLKLLDKMGREMDAKLEVYLNIHGHPKGFLDKRFLNDIATISLRDAYSKVGEEANFGKEITELILTETPSEKLKEAYKSLGKDPEKLYDKLILSVDKGNKPTLTPGQVNLLAEIIAGKKFNNKYMQELSDLLSKDLIEANDLIKKLLKIVSFAKDKYGPGGDEVIGREDSHEITGLLNALAYIFTTEFQDGRITKEGLKAGAGAYHIDESLYQELKNREQAMKEATTEEKEDLPKPQQPFTVANERSEMAATITKIIKSLSKNNGKPYWELFAYKYGEELPQELKKDSVDLIKRALKGLKIENGKIIAEEKIEGLNDNLGALLKLQKQLELTEVWKAALGVKSNAPSENFELFYKLSALKTSLDLFIKTNGLMALEIEDIEEVSDEGMNDFDEESDEYLERIAQLIKEDETKVTDLAENYCKR